jgi:predicted NBD/HSP70 family sugar kinase
VTAAKPSLELLRELSDEHVLRALMEEKRLTRAELAARTGISKPTVGESVRRLDAAGIVVDTGARSSGRGRAGSYYALADGIGRAFAVSIAPAGVAAELVDVHGDVVAQASEPLRRPARPDTVIASVRSACRRVSESATGPVRLAVVSAADPVDRVTGRLVQLPDAPFLIGELSPAEALAELVSGPVMVDNYLYLGEGLGAAVVTDGEVRRGHGGFAGEIAHVVTAGPGRRAMSFIDVFGELGLRHADSTAIDGAMLEASVTGPPRSARATRLVLGTAVAGVISAAVALADPAVVIIGGTWGTNPVVLEAVRAACQQLARPVAIRPALVTGEAPLAGARTHAVRELRSAVTRYRTTLQS